jgi:hypothetical protein
MTNNVLVVREYGPRLQLPAKLCCYGEQAPVQFAEPICTAKMMLLAVRAHCDKVSAALRELMRRRVRPRRLSDRPTGIEDLWGTHVG